LLESRFGPWHGGEVDTSLMLHLAPDLVDLRITPPTLLASAEKGARFYNAILSTLIQRLSPNQPT
jgi:creatinine amidohydrolase/Fe(II)-dependent formamide hydrolase-like protein